MSKIEDDYAQLYEWSLDAQKRLDTLGVALADLRLCALRLYRRGPWARTSYPHPPGESESVHIAAQRSEDSAMWQRLALALGVAP